MNNNVRYNAWSFTYCYSHFMEDLLIKTNKIYYKKLFIQDNITNTTIMTSQINKYQLSSINNTINIKLISFLIFL